MEAEGTAAVFSCTDPRLADSATAIIDQFKSALGVRRIIPFHSPGIIGLYADEKVKKRPIFLGDLQGDLCVEDIRRMAQEAEFGEHLSLHNPDRAVLVAHHDCKKCPGSDVEQKERAVLAARVLQHRLRRVTSFKGRVRPAMLELRPNPGWKVILL